MSQPRRIVCNTSDSNAVKTVLDENVISCLEKAGYLEDHFWSNVKLSAGFIGCVFALVGQFFPVPFPENTKLLMVCIAGYFLFTSLVQLPYLFLEQNTFLLTHSHNNKDALIVASILKRETFTYELKFGARRNGSFKSSTGFTQFDLIFAEYFDVNGVFLQTKFYERIELALSELSTKKSK